MPKSFIPSANTYAPAGVPMAVSEAEVIAVHAVDGAITLFSGVVHITKGSIAALTLAVPDQDGQYLKIISDTAFAHTVTTVSPGFNKNIGTLTLTFSGTAGDSLELESYDGAWWVMKSTGTIAVNYRQANSVKLVDGAITIKNGTVIITKASAAALTLAAPTATTDDGARLRIIDSTGYAHTITTAVTGFNGVGTYLVITFGAAVGDVVELEAYQGVWYVVKPQATKPMANGKFQVLTGDGAITVQNGMCFLTKGSAAAATLALPVADVDDGMRLTILSTTAFAHVVTQGTDGFNAKGSSGTATLGAAKGNGLTLRAYQGHWYSEAVIGCTFA